MGQKRKEENFEKICNKHYFNTTCFCMLLPAIQFIQLVYNSRSNAKPIYYINSIYRIIWKQVHGTNLRSDSRIFSRLSF